jgi:hypothetical protein
MCTVLLPPGVNPIVVNKYIKYQVCIMYVYIMYVFMYMCVLCICIIYVFMYVGVGMYIFSMHVFMYVCTYLFMCVCMYSPLPSPLPRYPLSQHSLFLRFP